MLLPLSLPPVVASALFVTLASVTARAQSPGDSTGVVRALGAALAAEARSVLNGFACFDGLHPCPMPRRETPDPLLAELVRAAGARLVPEAPGAVPPCP